MLLHIDPLKPPKVDTFVNILWPSTPPHAIIGFLVGAATHARLKLSKPLPLAVLKFGFNHQGGGPMECGIFFSH